MHLKNYGNDSIVLLNLNYEIGAYLFDKDGIHLFVYKDPQKQHQ